MNNLCCRKALFKINLCQIALFEDFEIYSNIDDVIFNTFLYKYPNLFVRKICALLY